MGCWQIFNRYVTVEPVVFLYFITIMLLNAGAQELFYQKFCRNHYNHSKLDCTNSTFQQSHPEIQGSTSTQLIYAEICLIIPLLFSLTFLGGYCDKHGIRLALVLPFVGSVVAYAWVAINCVFFDWSVNWLFASYLVIGVTGYFSGVVMAASTYVVLDSTHQPGLLPFRIALIEASTSVGSLIGGFITGPLIQYAGLTALYGCMAACNLLCLLDAALRLRPPRNPDKRSDNKPSLGERLSDLFSLESVREYTRVLTRRREKSLRGHIHLIVLAFLISGCSMAGLSDISYLYLTKEHGYSKSFYSLLSGFAFGSAALGNSAVMYVLSRKFSPEPTTYMVIGAVAGASYGGLMAYGQYSTVLWFTILPKMFFSYTSAGARLYIAKATDNTEAASIMGYLATVQSISALLASILFNGIYPLTLHTWAGVSYMIGGFMNVVVIVLATLVMFRDQKSA